VLGGFFGVGFGRFLGGWGVSVRFEPRTVLTAMVLMCRCRGSMSDSVMARSQVRLPAVPLPANNPGQVVHTHVPLSPSSIIWYRPNPGNIMVYGRGYMCIQLSCVCSSLPAQGQ